MSEVNALYLSKCTAGIMETSRYGFVRWYVPAHCPRVEATASIHGVTTGVPCDTVHKTRVETGS